MTELEIFLAVLWGMAPLWLPTLVAGVTAAVYWWVKERRSKQPRTLVRSDVLRQNRGQPRPRNQKEIQQ